MKLFLLACMVAVAVALPQQRVLSADEEAARDRDRNAQITSYTNEQTSDGGNNLAFETDNDISQQETIELRSVFVTDEDGNEVEKIIPFYRGSFSYLQPDGSFVQRSYYTDQFGIHFEGDDLPVAPEAF